jgi:hypothetical protein
MFCYDRTCVYNDREQCGRETINVQECRSNKIAQKQEEEFWRKVAELEEEGVY